MFRIFLLVENEVGIFILKYTILRFKITWTIVEELVHFIVLLHFIFFKSLRWFLYKAKY